MSTGTGPGPEHSDHTSPGYPAGAHQGGYSPAAHQPGYSAAAYQPGAGTGRNPAGQVALLAGIVVVVIGVVRQVVTYLLPTLMDSYAMSSLEAYRTFAYVGSAVSVLVGLIALIAGIIGLRGAGKPKGAAGAGCALGAWAVLSALAGLVLPFIVTGGI